MSSNNIADKTSKTNRRKKSRSKNAYLSKWLEKTMHYVQNEATDLETCDLNNSNWISSFNPRLGCDQNKINYNTSTPTSLPTFKTLCYPSAYLPDKNKNEALRSKQSLHSLKGDDVNSYSNCLSECKEHSSNYLQPKTFTDSQDYPSLPPIITSAGDTTPTTDKEKDSNDRGHSDPSINEIQGETNGIDSDSDSSSSVSGSRVSGRLILCLLDQIRFLKVTNEKISKELKVTKAELNMVKQQNSVWSKGPRLVNGSRNNNSHHNGVANGQYTPGFVGDVVREIRDAARLREDALYSRVHALMIDRTENCSKSEEKSTESTLQDIKNCLRASEADKRRMAERIANLKNSLRTLALASRTDAIAKMGPDDEKVRLHKEIADLRKAKENAEEYSLKLERLVTQLRHRCNGVQTPANGGEPSDEHEHARVRRASANSSTNSTIVFGPVTDL